MLDRFAAAVAFSRACLDSAPEDTRSETDTKLTSADDAELTSICAAIWTLW